MLKFNELEPETILYEAVLCQHNYPVHFNVEIRKYKFIEETDKEYIFHHDSKKVAWKEFYYHKVHDLLKLKQLSLTEEEAKYKLRNEFEQAYYSSLVREFFPVKND